MSVQSTGLSDWEHPRAGGGGSAGLKHTFSVDEFCHAHNLSRALFYKLVKAGKGPRLMKVGTRTMITCEAAADWRKSMEVVNP
jgi:hypothetical protein